MNLAYGGISNGCFNLYENLFSSSQGCALFLNTHSLPNARVISVAMESSDLTAVIRIKPKFYLGSRNDESV